MSSLPRLFLLLPALLLALALPPLPAAAKSDPQPRIELFTTSWCGYCNRARNYFRQKGLDFSEYDVEKDEAAARRHRKFNPRGGVPVVVIDGIIVPGYAPEVYDELLK